LALYVVDVEVTTQIAVATDDPPVALVPPVAATRPPVASAPPVAFIPPVASAPPVAAPPVDEAESPPVATLDWTTSAFTSPPSTIIFVVEVLEQATKHSANARNRITQVSTPNCRDTSSF